MRGKQFWVWTLAGVLALSLACAPAAHVVTSAIGTSSAPANSAEIPISPISTPFTVSLRSAPLQVCDSTPSGVPARGW